MGIRRRILLALPLAVLALAGNALLAPSAAAQGAAAPGGGSARPAGPASGGWDLAGLRNPGHLRGALLLGKSGVPAFLIDAGTARAGLGLPGGEVRGQAQILAGPFAGQMAEVHGTWHELARGVGRFEVELVLPGGPTANHPPVRLARLRGTFADLNGPNRPGGTWRGHWRAL